jgi:hypothetical protein
MLKRFAHWREARSLFQKSQKIYKTFVGGGRPTGEDAATLDAVIEEITRCDAALARPSGNGG